MYRLTLWRVDRSEGHVKMAALDVPSYLRSQPTHREKVRESLYRDV